MICRKCGQKNSNDVETCFNCGNPFITTNKYLIVIMILLHLFGIPFLIIGILISNLMNHLGIFGIFLIIFAWLLPIFRLIFKSGTIIDDNDHGGGGFFDMD